MSRKLEARVLVCDPKNKILPDLIEILSNRFDKSKFVEVPQTKPEKNGVDYTLPNQINNHLGIGSTPLDKQIKNLTKYMLKFSKNPEQGGPFELGGVEYTVVADLETLVKKIREHSKPFAPPHYSLVAYDASTIKENRDAASYIAKVRMRDYFLPQIIIGKGISRQRDKQCTRAGALYSAFSKRELYIEMNNLFAKPRILSNATVVKNGGSADDFDNFVKYKKNISYLCETLTKILYEQKRKINRNRLRTIMTSGAGQRGNRAKNRMQKYIDNPRIQEQVPKRIGNALIENLEETQPFFYNKRTGKYMAKVLNSGAFYHINDQSAAKKILLMPTAPHYKAVRDGIPLQDSDTHTIALAEHFGAEKVVLIKRTDGIYDFDPYRGFPLELTLPESKLVNKLVMKRWQLHQRHNKRHEVVSVDDLLSGKFSREGTGAYGRADGSTGHLMEDSALRYFKNNCKHVKEILVVHIAPEEMYYQVWGNRYKHIITKEETTLDRKGWKGFLEKSIRDAVIRGKANSKIVREYSN
ncbi:hypothetical protein JXC34_04280 [Candidatus Woesearchaeota archaeon]|nr:hypothetical protein [Candidatus Woesearchaeota archaeon]